MNDSITSMLLTQHNLHPSQELLDFITKNFSKLGICPPEDQIRGQALVNYFLGEYYALISKTCGEIAAPLMFKSRWNSEYNPDWFDHRISDLSEAYTESHVELSAMNTMIKLPLNGTILSLCLGDGYYEYTYYSTQASNVDCIEIQDICLEHAKAYHNRDNIHYKKGNILEENYGTEKYDVVTIRGAIEHFKEKDQIKIFKKANAALKENGYFCGDTPKMREDGHKQLKEHECEWKSEEEMRLSLKEVFSHIETNSYTTKSRTTLLWACRKHPYEN